MKRFIYLVLLCVLMFSSVADARDYHLLSLNVHAQLGADGAVRVREEHTVQFEGTYSGLFQWFDTSRGLKIRDLVVSEGGVLYQQIEGEKPGPAGTYFIRSTKDEVYVDWSFEARDETRIFQLDYTLDNIILKHRDVAEFYYQFVGKGWERPRNRVRVTLTLPQGAVLEEIGAWGYGPSHGQVKIVSPTEIVWEVDQLPARTFMEGRVVFPPSLVPGSSRVTNQLALPEIMAQEGEREQKAAALQRRKTLDPYVAFAAIALVFVLFSQMWRTYGKSHPGYQEKYYRELPATYPPVELAFLYHGTISSKDFTATIFDLARRGFLTIHEEATTFRFKVATVSPEQRSTLAPYEKQLLEFLFQDLKAAEISLEEIQEIAKKDTKRFNQFWSDWQKTAKTEGEKRDFYEDQTHKKVFWFLVPSVILLVGSIPLLISEMYFTGGVSLLGGFSLIIGTAIAASRRSPQGYLEYTKWKAFRRYLKDFSRVESSRTVAPGIWENYLPYAITLGVATRILKEWDVVFPHYEADQDQNIGWFIFIHSGGFTRLSRITDDVNKSISTTIISGSGGGGGGFSSGGGGGFGGGGGGAR